MPERAEYIRIITGELTRLQNHACLIGFLMQDMGASGTPLMYAFREREKILDLFEALTGSRMMCNYMRFGGCRVDLPAGWLEQAQKVVEAFPRFLDEFERCWRKTKFSWRARRASACCPRSWPSMPASPARCCAPRGVNYDIRKVDKYGIYDRFSFRVPLGEHGDVYDRYMIRLLEMRESVKILQQAMRDIPPGADHGSEDEDPRIPSESGRSLRTNRSSKGRAWFLSDQRRLAESVSLSRASAEPHQPYCAGGHVSRP